MNQQNDGSAVARQMFEQLQQIAGEQLGQAMADMAAKDYFINVQATLLDQRAVTIEKHNKRIALLERMLTDLDVELPERDT